MLELYGYEETAADAAQKALDLAGATYRYVHLENDMSREEYRRINPADTVPTLVDGELVLYETIAILLHVADTHPQAGLIGTVGSVDRALQYRWLAFVSNNLMGAFYRWFHAERLIEGDEHQTALRLAAVEQLTALGGRIEAEMGSGDWLVGTSISVADVLLAVIASWADSIDDLEFGGARIAAHRARVDAAS